MERIFYMNAISTVDVKKLREFYQRSAPARALLDDFAARERNRTETKVDNLRYIQVESRPITRGEIIEVFQELQKLGCGSFVVGRKGHSSRFQWRLGLPSVGKAAAGEEIQLDVVSEEDRRQEEATDVPEGVRKLYLFPLRPNLDLRLELPLDLSSAEAARVSDFIKSLPFDRTETTARSLSGVA
jgi:hypothetical protein